MEYPKLIYILSADPLHYGHLNTKAEAEMALSSPVSLLICLNDLKTNPLFSLEERRQIAQRYLPDEKIYTAATKEQVVEYLRSAKKIVRGIRGALDMRDIEGYARYYGVEDLANKLLLMPVVPPYSKISSSKLKSFLLEGKRNKVTAWAPAWIMNLVEKKLRQ